MDITEMLAGNGLLGVVIGALTFLVIGVFHPLVIKGEYYLGVRVRWAFLAVGLVCLACSMVVADTLWSSLLGVTGFSSLWGIGEVNQQQERVRKGWFPRNPRRRYPWDNDASPAAGGSASASGTASE